MYKIIKSYNDYERKNNMKLSKVEDFTCNKCDMINKCVWAWDLYNTNGDCIYSK